MWLATTSATTTQFCGAAAERHLARDNCARDLSNFREVRGGSNSKADQEANKCGRDGDDCVNCRELTVLFIYS